MDPPSHCNICASSFGKDLSNTVVIRSKGALGINNASASRSSDVHVAAGDRVHIDCRQKFVNPKSIELQQKTSQSSTVSERQLRSVDSQFSFENHCVFCGQSAKVADRRRSVDVCPVKTSEFSETIKTLCHQRNDEWATSVL